VIVGWKIFNAKTWKQEKKSKCIFGVLTKKNKVKRNVLETRERRMLVIFCCLSNKDGKKGREREKNGRK
jgi:hypothetical protein